MFPDHVITYIQSQKVGVLAVEMPDGSPHGSTVHFVYDSEKNTFLFETNKEYRKSQALHDKEKIRASLVIGTNEEDMKTLQIDGVAMLITEDQKEWWNNIYLEKFPNKKEKSTSPSVVRFIFVPTWYRFSDWKTPQGKQIIGTDYI